MNAPSTTAPAEPLARTTSIRIPAPLHQHLRAAAARNERSISAEARLAIREHLQRQPSPDRAA